MTYHENPKRDTLRRSATERAYDELKFKIRENVMLPGTQYLESELALMLGMSRTPVREACIRLAEEGALEIKPRHGIRILPISPDDMREIYVILTELESTAAKLSATRGLSKRDIDLLEGSVCAMEKALAKNDLEKWAREDENFHKLLVCMSGNKRLSTVVNMFWDQTHRARLVTLKMRPKPDDSTSDHRAVLEAIKAGDGERAAEIHYQHRVRAGKLIVGLLAKFGISHV